MHRTPRQIPCILRTYLTITLIVIQKTIPAPHNKRGMEGQNNRTHFCSAVTRSQSFPRSPPSSPSGQHDRSAVQDVCSHPCTMLLSCEPNEGTHLRSVSRKKKKKLLSMRRRTEAWQLTAQICCWDFFPVNPKC